jgi:hypothetical protein
MSSDELLRKLAQVAREESRRVEEEDASWQKLARGELGERERAELESLLLSDAEAARKWEAYRPLDDAAKDRIAHRLGPLASAGKTLAKSRAPGSRTRARWLVPSVVGVTLAAAAAAVLVLQRSRPNRLLVAENALPAYSLAVTGGDQPTRSASASASPEITVRVDSRLEILLRPATGVNGNVSVAGFIGQGGAWRPWNPPVQISTEGSARVAGTAGELMGVAPGTWDIALAVGRPGTLPSEADVEAELSHPARHDWQLFSSRVRLTGRP